MLARNEKDQCSREIRCFLTNGFGVPIKKSVVKNERDRFPKAIVAIAGKIVVEQLVGELCLD